MIHKYKYTFISLMIAILFILGNMVIMTGILSFRETQLLAEGGTAEIESPVRAWLEPTNDWNAVSDDTHQMRYELTFQQMENAINHWNSREGDFIHEPVAGQISMEQAIESGKEWLIEMGIASDPASGGNLTDSVNATLGVGKKKETSGIKLEPYYSFWTVQYANRAMDARLLVNAVTGKVWGAKLTIYENIPKKPTQKDAAIFWKMAGLSVPKDNLWETSIERTRSIYSVKGTELYLQIGYSHFNVNEDAIVDYSDVFHKEYVIITYDFITSEE